MASAQLTCRIRVRKAESSNADALEPQESTIFALRDCPDVGIEIRTQWAREVMKLFGKLHDHIRPWDLLARLDGSVTHLTMPASVKRAEMFALASLLYEIISGTQPFEGLTDDEVQHRFSNGDFPDDAISFPYSLFIYSGWSEEFSGELARRVKAQDISILQAIGNYAKAHPVRTGIQIVGLTLSAVSFFAMPILGAVGFTAAGPAAGSAAAAWQASIGAVEAGSLFAWCRSAAMGGAAVGGIQVAGVAGATLTKVTEVPGLVETFKSVFRTSNHIQRS